jgi:hypothetical protein
MNHLISVKENIPEISPKTNRAQRPTIHRKFRLEALAGNRKLCFSLEDPNLDSTHNFLNRTFIFGIDQEL